MERSQKHKLVTTRSFILRTVCLQVGMYGVAAGLLQEKVLGSWTVHAIIYYLPYYSVAMVEIDHYLFTEVKLRRSGKAR